MKVQVQGKTFDLGMQNGFFYSGSLVGVGVVDLIFDQVDY